MKPIKELKEKKMNLKLYNLESINKKIINEQMSEQYFTLFNQKISHNNLIMSPKKNNINKENQNYDKFSLTFTNFIFGRSKSNSKSKKLISNKNLYLNNENEVKCDIRLSNSTKTNILQSLNNLNKPKTSENNLKNDKNINKLSKKQLIKLNINNNTKIYELGNSFLIKRPKLSFNDQDYWSLLPKSSKKMHKISNNTSKESNLREKLIMTPALRTRKNINKVNNKNKCNLDGLKVTTIKIVSKMDKENEIQNEFFKSNNINNKSQEERIKRKIRSLSEIKNRIQYSYNNDEKFKEYFLFLNKNKIDKKYLNQNYFKKFIQFLNSDYKFNPNVSFKNEIMSVLNDKKIKYNYENNNFVNYLNTNFNKSPFDTCGDEEIVHLTKTKNNFFNSDYI